MAADTAFEVGRLYGPIKSISDVLTASTDDVFIGLPGLEGYYPMSVVTGTGQAINIAQAGGPLTQTGIVPIGYDGNSYRKLGSGINYLFVASTYNMTGTETFIDSSIRGFTLGGWFMIETTPTSTSGLISKSGVGPQLGYELRVNTANQLLFSVSGNGTSRVTATGPVVSLTEWSFFVGRFIPSAEVAVFSNAVKTVNITSVPVSEFVSSQNFEVGRYGASDARIINAKVRDVFVCRAALSDAVIESIRTATVP